MLSTKQLGFAYNANSADAITALKGVDLAIQPGELVAIIGHNGSGKSTLAKILAGVLLPTSGSFMVDEVAASRATIWEIRRRVGLVFQRPDDQLVANTVIDDVAFGPENLGLPRGEIEQRVASVLAALGISNLTNSQISELSGGEKQRVAIAGVLAMQPNYLILDEPTTMIAPALARQLLALVRDLRERTGLAVIHITHFMHEVVDFDRLVVMEAGQILMQGSPREVFAEVEQLRSVGLNIPLITELGYRLVARGVALPPTILSNEELRDALSQLPQQPRTSPPAPTAPPISPTPRPPLIEVQDATFTYMAGTPLAQPALRGVTCQVFEGETLAILGGVQAGKSTLIECMNALRRPHQGRVLFEQQDINAAGFDQQALRHKVGIVFQQPESQLLEETVGLDVSYVPRQKKLPPADSRAIVQRVLTEVGLDYETFRLRYIYALSGGQKRRVAIAGVLAAEPRVLILDEPVAGLDPRGRNELADLIANLTKQRGLTVVLVGNAIDQLAELADRAIVLHEGRVVQEGTLRSLLGRAEELHALGLELSEAAEIALVLRSIFPLIPTDLLHLEELEAAILAELGRPSAAEGASHGS
ncbi:MAG: energy-coupling factor transporter ATPase [Roseiflexaceae bacterium]